MVRFERDGMPAGEVTIPRLAAGEVRSVSTVWSNLVPGEFCRVTVTVYPAAGVVECNPFNNSLSVLWLVAEHRIFLPVIARMVSTAEGHEVLFGASQIGQQRRGRGP